MSSARTWEWTIAAGLPVLFLILLCTIWQQLIDIGSVSPVLLPRPTEIIGQIKAQAPALFRDATVTGSQALVSLLLAAAAGFVVGALLSASVLLRETVYPCLVTLQLLPKVAMAPLFVLWLGTGDASRIAFGTFLSFFPVLLATLTGLEQTDQNAIRLCRALTATPLQTFWTVRLPFAASHIFAGLKVAATLSVTGIVIGEFMTADRGLGYVIIGSATRLDSRLLFAAMFALCVTGLAMFAIVLAGQSVFRFWYLGRWRP